MVVEFLTDVQSIGSTADAVPGIVVGLTVTLPLEVATVHVLPMVLIAYVIEPLTVGVPLIVRVVPITDEVTPAGKPETFAPVAPPPNVYVMLARAVF